MVFELEDLQFDDVSETELEREQARDDFYKKRAELLARSRGD